MAFREKLGFFLRNVVYFLRIIHIYVNTHRRTPFTNGIKGLMELNRVQSNCLCPRVNDNFTGAVVVAAVEPCELCDHVQMQGNCGSKWVLGERI